MPEEPSENLVMLKWDNTCENALVNSNFLHIFSLSSAA